MTVGAVADHVDVSIRSLFNGFKSFRGMSPADFIRNARLDLAREQLMTTSDCVADIAARCGYAHAGNFAARYHLRFGEAPAQARRFRPI